MLWYLKLAFLQVFGVPQSFFIVTYELRAARTKKFENHCLKKNHKPLYMLQGVNQLQTRSRRSLWPFVSLFGSFIFIYYIEVADDGRNVFGLFYIILVIHSIYYIDHDTYKYKIMYYFYDTWAHIQGVPQRFATLATPHV